MIFLLIALGVFFVVTIAQTLVVMQDWAWAVLMVVLSLVGLWLCHDLRHWYAAPAISGIGLMTLRVENLLLVKADESLSNVRRHRR